MGKVWKNGCEEDKFINKLIKKGKIKKHTTPTMLQDNYPDMFGEFTIHVIRYHLNLLKKSNGLLLDGGNEEVSDDMNDKNLDEKEKSKTIEDNKTTGTSGVTISGFDHVFHQNYPVICEVYKDPKSQYDKVALIVTLPAGVQNVKIEVSDSGITAKIKYQWSNTIFNMEDLFRKLLDSKQIDIHHPRILCIKNGQQKYRKLDMNPEGLMTVYLPIKVQTADDSWTKFGIKRGDGTQIIVADFTGFINDYNKKLTDTVVVFE